MIKSEEKTMRTRAIRACLCDVLLATDCVYSKDTETAKKALQRAENSLRELLSEGEPPKLYKIEH